MPKLIDPQQKGFIKGQHIQHNILAFKLGREYIKFTRQLASFLKLDFVKAYDCLEHSFLLETLTALGFSTLVTSLLLGLIIGGLSKVHFNGLFTNDFPLSRGVQ